MPRGGSMFSKKLVEDMRDAGEKEPHPVGYENEGRAKIPHRLVTKEEMRDMAEYLKTFKGDEDSSKLSIRGKILSKLPEIHMLNFEKGYPRKVNFAGPGTRLLERLEKGTIPLDMADQYAMYHDINYSLFPEKEERAKADDILIEQLRRVINDKEASKSAKINARLMIATFKVLGKLGAGFKEGDKKEDDYTAMSKYFMKKFDRLPKPQRDELLDRADLRGILRSSSVMNHPFYDFIRHKYPISTRVDIMRMLSQIIPTYMSPQVLQHEGSGEGGSMHPDAVPAYNLQLFYNDNIKPLIDHLEHSMYHGALGEEGIYTSINQLIQQIQSMDDYYDTIIDTTDSPNAQHYLQEKYNILKSDVDVFLEALFQASANAQGAGQGGFQPPASGSPANMLIGSIPLLLAGLGTYLATRKKGAGPAASIPKKAPQQYTQDQLLKYRAFEARIAPLEASLVFNSPDTYPDTISGLHRIAGELLQENLPVEMTRRLFNNIFYIMDIAQRNVPTHDISEEEGEGMRRDLLQSNKKNIVQSIMFDRDIFDRSAASKYLREHGLIGDKVDETKNNIRYRQFEATHGKSHRFRTVMVEPGVKVVLNYVPKSGGYLHDAFRKKIAHVFQDDI